MHHVLHSGMSRTNITGDTDRSGADRKDSKFEQWAP
jgi:hypothetical protein